MKKFELFFSIVKVPLDFVMTVLAFLTAYSLRLKTDSDLWFAKEIDAEALPTLTDYADFSIYSAIALILIFALGKAYSLKSTMKLSKESGRIIILWLVWMMTIIAYYYFTRSFPYSRLGMAYSWGITLIFIIFGRSIIRLVEIAFLRMGIGRRHLLFIGNNKITKQIKQKLSNHSSYKIVGTVSDLKSLKAKIKEQEIDEVIQTKSKISETKSEEILEFCEAHHIEYRFVPDLIEVKTTNINIDTINGIPVISLKPTPLDGWGKVSKRIMDILGAGLGLVILSPVLLITAIAIKLDSKGPILFSKLDDGSPVKRIGQRGKPFRFYKFRSMIDKSHSRRYKDLAKNNIRTDGPLVKIENDPRITKVGRFIRRTSIDELPQLWNVLVGNMSLVGPRPHLPEEVAKYQRHHKFVLTIKPGITGLAQVSGRSDLSFEEEVRLDRYYIENWSILFDIKLIFRTLGVILRGYQE